MYSRQTEVSRTLARNTQISSRLRINSALLCYPVGIWTLYVLYRKMKFPKMDMLWLFLGALFYHVVLMAGIVGATKAGLPDWAQGLIMVTDAVCLFGFWWLVGKKSKQVA